MVERLSAMVIWTARYEACVAFYRALGLDLEDEDHGDGHIHAACDVGGAHLAIFGARGEANVAGHREVGGTMCGFVVTDVDAVATATAAAGGSIKLAPESVPWGRRAVLHDPDGRAVEITRPG